MFLSDLSDKLADLEYAQNDSDHNFQNWNDIFASLLNKHAPIKIKRVKKEIKPEWLTEVIKA